VSRFPFPSIYRPIFADAHKAGIKVEERKKHLAFTHPELGVIAILPYHPNESGTGHKKTHAAIRRAARRLAA
jgi:hypothetical protein